MKKMTDLTNFEKEKSVDVESRVHNLLLEWYVESTKALFRVEKFGDKVPLIYSIVASNL